MKTLPLTYEEIIEFLNANLPYASQKEAITKISKLLNVSETTIYNKFHARSKFTIEELFMICNEVNISLDGILYHNTKRSFVPYFADGLLYTPRNFVDYLNNIIGYYSQIKKLPNVHGYFLANEVPLFHFLFFPNLFYLKMYIWNNMNWNIPIYKKDYDPYTFINNPEIKTATEILKSLFCSFPSEEIWNPSLLDITVAQIKFLKETQVLNEIHATVLKDELNELLTYLEALSNSGQKFLSNDKEVSPINICITDLNMGSELILVKSDNIDMLFQQLDAPNYIRSTDENMCNYVWEYYNKIKKRSSSITKGGEKDKRLFFQRLNNQIKTI